MGDFFDLLKGYATDAYDFAADGADSIGDYLFGGQSAGNNVPTDSTGWLDRYVSNLPALPDFHSPDYSIFTGETPANTVSGAVPQMSRALQETPSMTSLMQSGLQMAPDSGNEASVGLLGKIQKAVSPLEDFMNNNKNTVALGAGGLQFLAALQKQKKLQKIQEDAIKRVEDERAQRQANWSNYSRPLGTYTAPTRQAVGPINYRQAGTPESRTHYTGGSTVGNMMAEGGQPERYVAGGSGGQEDDIPAALSPGEYVFDADAVAALGDGNNAAGAKKLDEMRVAIRKHKRGASPKSIPPKAKSPLQYLKGTK